MPRRQRVTRDLVLSEALTLVDEVGLEGLTMRRLGDRVGADPAMIYRMFANKEELVEALADAVFSGAGARPAADSKPEDPPQDPLEQLRRSAHGVRRALLAHPGLIGVAVRRPPRQEGTFHGIDTGLGLLLSAGLPPEEAALGYQAVLFYTLGFVVLEAPFAASEDRGAAQQADTQLALATLPPDQFPHIAATLQHLYTPDLDGQFDHGLRLLLTGLSAKPAPTTDHSASSR